MKLIARTLDLVRSPMDSAHALLQQYQGVRPVLDLSQGVPNYPTAKEVADHVAKVAYDPDGSKYTPRAGLIELRKLMAEEISQAYEGTVRSDQVLITAGCNQAFCLAVSALADGGDEIILPVPYFFDHYSWLRLEHISPVFLNTEPSYIPDPKVAEALITDKTRAIILVTPGNPTGVTISPSVIQEFANLAKKYDIVLVIDETYRIFRAIDKPAHNLFCQQTWDDHVISLHSFSKEFAIPGYRVGAAICHPNIITEMLKLFGCIAVCAPRIGQEAVIAALSTAKAWRYERVLEMRKRRAYFEFVFKSRPGGFELSSAGAFYGWIKHPSTGESTNQVVRRLLLEQGLLVFPGTIFTPTDDHYLRFSFAGLSYNEMDEMQTRLCEYS